MHVSSRSAKIRGVITNSDILEGLAVTLSNSGVVNGLQTDLPIVGLAPSGTRLGVHILGAAPDNFPRPVDLRQYRAGWQVVSDKTVSTGYSEPLETVTRYNVGMSNLDNPTVPSGIKANAHRGGTYVVPSDCYVDSAGIRVPGSYVEVGSNGKWQYTGLATNAVATVVEWHSDTLNLVFELTD